MITAFTSLKKLFLSEIETELNKYPVWEIGTIGEKDIAHLPEPVKRYLGYCGYINKMDVLNARVTWQDVYLKTDPGKKWMKIDCHQFNSIAEPTRIVYMKAKLSGVVLFEGRDKCQDGQGNMLIRLMKFLTIANVEGKEMDASALVTALAESFLISGYIFQNYISWTAIDPASCQATLKFKGTEVTGIFNFNDAGECTHFVTDDRYYSTKGRGNKKIRWTVTYGHYHYNNGIRFPGYLTASWNLKDGDFQYFKGNVAGVEFNVKKP